MSKSPETLRVIIPLSIKKKNGRPTILPPEGLATRESRAQDPHILRAVGRSLGWRKRLKQGHAGTIHDIAAAKNLSDSYVACYIRLSYLAPDVLEMLLIKRTPPAVSLVRMIEITRLPWSEQAAEVFGPP